MSSANKRHPLASNPPEALGLDDKGASVVKRQRLDDEDAAMDMVAPADEEAAAAQALREASALLDALHPDDKGGAGGGGGRPGRSVRPTSGGKSYVEKDEDDLFQEDKEEYRGETCEVCGV